MVSGTDLGAYRLLGMSLVRTSKWGRPTLGLRVSCRLAARVRTTSYALSTSALVEGSLQRLSEITSVVCSILKELETRFIDQFEEMPLRAICVGGPEGVSSESTSIHISDDINPRCN
jgi:hypothetical protein